MKLLKNSALVVGADIADTALVLLRNVVLARLLSVEQFGIVATFSILMTLVEASQNAGLSRMIVQARDADQGAVQDTLHRAQLLLGIGAALLMALIAWPYALAMGTPSLVVAYLVFAVVPLIKGAAHLDPYRLQRKGRFGPLVLRQLIPQLISVAAIWPLYRWLGDYRVIIGCILINQTFALLFSHLGAERRYRLHDDPVVLARARAFGWPVMINGMLMFFVMNGDRMIVSNQFGHAALGAFSAAFMLTFMPTTVMARSLQSVLLPRLSRVQDDLPDLQRLYDVTAGLTMLIAVLFVGGIAAIGLPVLMLVFGSKYAVAGPYLVLLAAMQAIRFIRVAPVLAAMARAETRNPLYANLVRGAFIPLSLLVALWTRDVQLMLLAGIAGEIIACAASSIWARAMVALETRYFLGALGATVLLIGGIAGAALAAVPIWVIVPASIPFVVAMRRALTRAKEVIRGARLAGIT